MKKIIKITSFVFILLSMCVLPYLTDNEETVSDFNASPRFWEPSEPAGTGTFSDMTTVKYRTIGYDLNYDGVMTSVSEHDPAFIHSDTANSCPSGYTANQTVVNPTGNGYERIIQGCYYVKMTSGGYQWWAFAVELTPSARLDVNAPVLGRSLADNLVLETSGATRDNLISALKSGGSGWVNSIEGVWNYKSHPSCPSDTYPGECPNSYAGKLWKDGNNAYEIPSQTFFTKANLDNSGNWSYFGIDTQTFPHMFDIPVTFPPLSEIDNTPPTATASPDHADWTNQPVTVTMNFSDTGGSGINEQQYHLDTSPYDTATWDNYTSPVTISSEGIWYLDWRSSDFAGNVSSGGLTGTTFGPYKIDLTSPSGTFTPGTPAANGNTTVNFTPSDNLSGVKKYEYCVSTDGGLTYQPCVTVNSSSGTDIALTSGFAPYTLKAMVWDNAGNVSPWFYISSRESVLVTTSSPNFPSTEVDGGKPVTLTLNYSPGNYGFSPVSSFTASFQLKDPKGNVISSSTPLTKTIPNSCFNASGSDYTPACSTLSYSLFNGTGFTFKNPGKYTVEYTIDETHVACFHTTKSGSMTFNVTGLSSGS